LLAKIQRSCRFFDKSHASSQFFLVIQDEDAPASGDQVSDALDTFLIAGAFRDPPLSRT